MSNGKQTCKSRGLHTHEWAIRKHVIEKRVQGLSYGTQLSGFCFTSGGDAFTVQRAPEKPDRFRSHPLLNSTRQQQYITATVHYSNSTLQQQHVAVSFPTFLPKLFSLQKSNQILLEIFFFCRQNWHNKLCHGPTVCHGLIVCRERFLQAKNTFHPKPIRFFREKNQSEQPCRTIVPNNRAEQPCRTTVPNNHAEQPCRTTMPNNRAEQPCQRERAEQLCQRERAEQSCQRERAELSCQRERGEQLCQRERGSSLILALFGGTFFETVALFCMCMRDSGNTLIRRK